MTNPLENDLSLKRKTHGNNGRWLDRSGSNCEALNSDNGQRIISEAAVSDKDTMLALAIQAPLPMVSTEQKAVVFTPEQRELNITRNPSDAASWLEIGQPNNVIIWEAFRNLVWFRRLFFVYFVLLILQGVNAFYHHSTWYGNKDIIWNPVATSCLFFILFLSGVAYQYRSTKTEKPIKWPTLQDLNGTSIFFAAYLVLSPILMQTLHALNLHVCQSVWHQTLVCWAFFILFLSSPLYDLVLYLGTLVPITSIRSHLEKNFERKITFAQILSGQKQVDFNIKNYKFALDMFEQRLVSWQPLAVLLLGFLVGAIVQAVVGICTADFLTHALQLILIVPTIFPLLALGGALLWKRIEKTMYSSINQDIKKKRDVLQSVKSNFRKRLERLALYEFPMFSVFLAVLTGISMFTFWPLGTANYIADWLMCSVRDANITASPTTDQWLIYGASTFLWLALYRFFVPIAWRLGSFYQLFLQKLVLKSSDNGLPEAVADVISMPQTKVRVRPQHPHWRSVKESIQYIASCYAILFCLVAFCPGYLGQTITGWLNQSIKDADPIVLEIGKVQHPSMPWYPGMTSNFYINWTDANHGTYTNNVPNNVLTSPDVVSVVNAQGIHHSNYQPYQLDGLAHYSNHNKVRRDQNWKAACLTGNLILKAPSWIYKTMDHFDASHFLISISTICNQYRQIYESDQQTLPATRWQTQPNQIYTIDVPHTMINIAGVPHTVHNWIGEPSVPVTLSTPFVLGSGAEGGTKHYLIGKDLSNSFHWNINLNNHFNLRIFLASIVAAFGTAPFAIMTCAFLPLRRPDEMFVSEQGVLQPNRLIGKPLLLWKDLHKVCLLNTKRTERSRHILKFVFKPGRTIKIRLNTISPEHLREILALADEYSINCQFDNKVIDLRRELLKENLSSSASASKFESTIFRPLIAGDTLNGGKLRIIRKMASKPLSAVYLARNEQSRLVIVKQFVTPNDDAISTKYKSMFQREHNLIGTLSHPMMAKLIDSFDENGATYLVIEHITGENLRSIVERHGARSERIIASWANQICQFMQYLHSQNPAVLHRDLTPDNIMLTDNGLDVRIIDFGAAHQFMEGVTGTLIGKQCYIAPEQLRGKANIQSDIYSFGCTLYFLLSGKDPKALSQSDLTETDTSVSAVMQDLIKRCTEFDDTKRPKSFTEIAAMVQPVTNNKSSVGSFNPSKLLARFNAICTDFPSKIRELMS